MTHKSPFRVSSSSKELGSGRGVVGCAEGHAEGEAEILQLAFDFAEGRFAEAAYFQQVVLREFGEIADGMDLGGFETVTGANRQVHGADGLVELVLELFVHLGGGDHVVRQFGVEVVAGLEVLNEGVQVLAEDLGGFDEGHIRADGAVGPDFEDQTIVVGLLSDAGVFGLVADARDGGVDGVDRNGADDLFFGGVLQGGDKTAALMDFEFEVEFVLVGEGGDHLVLVVDGDSGIADEIAGGDDARALLGDGEHFRNFALHRDNDRLHVEDDVGDIFHDAFDLGEFMLNADDLHGDGGSAFKRREQDATEGISDSGAKASFKGLDDEFAVGGRLDGFIVLDTGGQFKTAPTDTHGGVPFCYFARRIIARQSIWSRGAE